MIDLDQLAEALRERGLESTYAVRIGDLGRRKIMVIKVVRELTRWGLAQAKAAVEDLAVIVEGVTLERAEAAAAALEEAGASIELTAAAANLYAFDPNDPRRGDQELERARVLALDPDSGSELALGLDRGRLGAWSEAAESTSGPLERFTELDPLLDALDQARARWAAAGKRECSSELELLEQLSARDLALEDRLRASEGEDRLREAAVYGDWLQTRGDPRGQLAAATLSDDPAARAELGRLIEAHASHLFGPGHALIVQGADLVWSGPVLDGLRLRLREGDEEPAPLAPERLTELLATPLCACLRALAIERPSSHDVGSELGLGLRIAAAPCAPGLRELRITHVQDLSLRGQTFVRLEILELEGGTFTLDGARLPALRELAVDVQPRLAPLSDCFTGLEAPALEHLRIAARTYDYWDQNFGPLQGELFVILQQPAFAGLRSLRIALAEDSIPLRMGLADLLARVPAIATLERVDLREAIMDPGCRTELERARDRLPGLLLPS